MVKVPPGVNGLVLLSKLEKQYGLKVAGGQDSLKGKIIRVAHMGHIDQFDVLRPWRARSTCCWRWGSTWNPGQG